MISFFTLSPHLHELHAHTPKSILSSTCSFSTKSQKRNTFLLSYFTSTTLQSSFLFFFSFSFNIYVTTLFHFLLIFFSRKTIQVFLFTTLFFPLQPPFSLPHFPSHSHAHLLLLLLIFFLHVLLPYKRPNFLLLHLIPQPINPQLIKTLPLLHLCTKTHVFLFPQWKRTLNSL